MVIDTSAVRAMLEEALSLVELAVSQLEAVDTPAMANVMDDVASTVL